MEDRAEKKKKTAENEQHGEDRISALPDDILHKILSFLDYDMKLLVQTCVLSKRWKLVWTTLPFLKFKFAYSGIYKNADVIIRNVLNHRNHHTFISTMELVILPPDLVGRCVRYGIDHRVQDLNVSFRGDSLMLSEFSSIYLRKLKLRMFLQNAVTESGCWDLPALTTLQLTGYSCVEIDRLEIYLTCLPALSNLRLRHLKLESLSFSLPDLTTLILSQCKLPNKVWNFPALKSLMLHDLVFPENMSAIFSALVSLQNLIIFFKTVPIQASLISCPQLVNLEIRTCQRPEESINNNIVVLAPKLSNFTSLGIFPITFRVSKLDTVCIKMQKWIDNKKIWGDKLKEFYQGFTYMLPRLGAAKILYLDSEAVGALSSISSFLENFPSPFYNLKYVKLPHGYEETSISGTLKSYLIDGSPTAIFVTSLPQNIIPRTVATSVTADVVPQKTLAAPTKVLIDSKNIHKTVGVDTVDLGVQEHVVQDSVLLVGKVRQAGPPVVKTDDDQVGCSRGKSESGLWRGHEINSEFVCLLDLIMNKYPETFEHFTTKNKKVIAMKLNILCTSVNNFTKISMSEVDTEIIAEFRDIFASLQKFGFNVSWLVNRLNFIEQLHSLQPLVSEIHAIDCCIKDARTELQDLQSLRAEKIQEIQKAYGTMGTNLVVGCIGDDLFSNP